MLLNAVSLKSTLLWQNVVAFTPSLEIVNNWVSATTSDYPDNVFIALIDLLMLCICRYKCKVPRHQVLPLLAIPPADDGTVAFGCVDNRV